MRITLPPTYAAPTGWLLVMVLGLVLFLATGSAAHAQSFTAEAKLSTKIINDGSTLAITVGLRASTTVALGSSNVAFTFNADALGFPAQPEKGTDYTYATYDGEVDSATYQSTVTRSGDELSVNIGLVTLGKGARLDDSFEEVVTIYMTILDPAQTTRLMWSYTEVMLDDFTEAASYNFAGEDTLLPVEITSFEAVLDGQSAELRWTTASETNNAGFEVQRISQATAPNEDPHTWKVLGFVDGQGTTLETQAYSYRASDLAAGTHRFRLKQIDYDGAFDYSPEVEVTVGVAGAFVFAAPYPNPFRTRAQFSLGVARAQHVEVVVYDGLGRRVQVLFAGMLEANHTSAFGFNAQGLPSGLYLVRAEGEHFTGTHRVVLAR